MAADAGAQRIHDLLNQQAPSLNRNLARVAKAAGSVHENPYGVMSQSGVDALAEVRRFYRGLRRQIAAVKTADGSAKADALRALDTLDAAFGAYEGGLDLGISPSAVPKLENAEKKSRQAQKKMRRAIAGLSR